MFEQRLLERVCCPIRMLGLRIEAGIHLSDFSRGTQYRRFQ